MKKEIIIETEGGQIHALEMRMLLHALKSNSETWQRMSKRGGGNREQTEGEGVLHWL